jgi:signal transduction histidine kinase
VTRSGAASSAHENSEPGPIVLPVTHSAATSQLIIDIATSAAGERDLDQILHEALDRLQTVSPLTGGSIALVDGDELVIRAAVGPFADEARGQRLRRGPSRSWSVIETLEPCLIGDLHATGNHVRGARASEGIRSWLAVPIVRRGRAIGLLEIDSTVVDIESGRLPDRAFELVIDGELPLVGGEETYVEQVVRNLLTNAAKYSAAPAPIIVKAERVDDEAVVRVVDEGIGLPASETAQAFELFYRSPNATRVAQGAGIGLFVCRQLVEAMGGRIWAAPREGGGTEVGFALPASPVADDGDGHLA